LPLGRACSVQLS